MLTRVAADLIGYCTVVVMVAGQGATKYYVLVSLELRISQVLAIDYNFVYSIKVGWTITINVP